MAKLWSKTRPLKGSPLFTLSDFLETFDGGQAFSWYRNSDDSVEGIFSKTPAKLCLNADGKICAAFLDGADIAASEKLLLEYIDANRNYLEITKPQTDKHIKLAAEDFPTLRILKQDSSTAIISFICSSSKRIVQIKQCIKLLSENLGDKVHDNFYALPTFQQIANADDAILKACKLGFRAKYLKQTAQKILTDKFDPNSLRTLPYADAKKYLLTLSGVGEKVADCILLFGAAKFEAFPVDTWISKVMSELYSLENPKETRAFAAKKWGKHAGYIQQILFASIRKRSNAKK